MERLHYLLVLFCFASLALRAEKAGSPKWDDGYRPYQDVAPEYLEIHVSKVLVKDGGSLFGSSSKVELQAEVTQVFRSASGLRQGSPLLIAYTRKSQAGPLTLEPSIPKEGQTVPAFLRKKGSDYEPAALHHSFEPLSPQQLLILSKNGDPKPAVVIATPPPEPIPPKAVPMAVPLAEKVEPTPEPPPPRMMVTAPKPESAYQEKAEPAAKGESVLQPTPVPPKPVVKKKKGPAVTDPIVIRESEKTEPTPAVAVIAEPLPERQMEARPTPQGTPVAAKIETTPPPPEPIVIKTIEPAPTSKPSPGPQKEAPAPPLLAVSEAPAAVAPPAPSSAPFDQEGLTAYAAIYAKIKEGDKASDSNEKETALKIYKETLMDLEKLKINKPDFQPFIVEYRQKDLARKISSLESESKK